MKYIELVGLYEAIGATMKSLEITLYIVDFLKKIPGSHRKNEVGHRRILARDRHNRRHN